jgi:hypothetical protein
METMDKQKHEKNVGFPSFHNTFDRFRPKCEAIKKATLINNVAVAPLQGLEPWTYGLTVRRSNQLS